MESLPPEGRHTRRSASPWARKRRRVLVWACLPLLVLVPWALWRAGVARDVRAQLAVLEAAGQPVTLAQLNGQNGAPAGSANAATLYREALSLYRDVPPAEWNLLPFLGTVVLEPGKPLSPEAREATAAWIAVNESTLQKLDDSREVAYCRYFDPYKPAGYNDLADLRRLDTLPLLACATAAFHADRGEAEAAGVALCSALALARSMVDTGLFTILAGQWEIEGRVLQALQYAMSRCTLPYSTLDDFEAYFSPARRREQIARMIAVERCLFLARIREGYRRGMGRNILIATGVGDLNARAYTELMAHVAAWCSAPSAEQGAIEQEFERDIDAIDNGALLFLTLNISQPPGHWFYYRKALDEAALARVGLALYRYHAAHGVFPDTLDLLAPEIAASDLVLQTTNEAMAYENMGERAEVHNGGLAEFRRGISTGPPNDGTPIDRNTLERISFLIAPAAPVAP